MGCFEKTLRDSKDLRDYLRSQTGIEYDEKTSEGKDEWIKAARDLQDHTARTLNDVYVDAGVTGIKATTSKLIKDYRNKTGVTKDAIPDDELLKSVAQQAQNLGTNPETGKVELQSIENPKAYDNTVSQAGKELTEVAVKKFPAKELLAQEPPPKESKNDMAGLSHSDWFLKNKDKFTPDEFAAIKENLSGNEEDKQKAIDEIVAKKDELKNAPPTSNEGVGKVEQDAEEKKGSRVGIEPATLKKHPTSPDKYNEKWDIEETNIDKGDHDVALANAMDNLKPKYKVGIDNFPSNTEGGTFNSIATFSPDKGITISPTSAEDYLSKLSEKYPTLDKFKTLQFIYEEAIRHESEHGDELYKTFDNKKAFAKRENELTTQSNKRVEDFIKENINNNKTNENATQKGNIEKSNLAEHQNGSEIGKTTTSGNRNSIEQSGEVKQEKVNEGGGKEPPTETPPIEEVNPPDEEGFASVRKEKLKEIEGAKKIFEKREKIPWTETYQKGLENVQKMYPNKTLYEAMKSRVDSFAAKLDAGEIFNPTSEDNAVFTVFRAETDKRIGQIEGLNSDDATERNAALLEAEPLEQDLVNIARVTNPEGEAGRAFNILQSLAKLDPNNWLKLMRMKISRAKGGEPLTPEEQAWTEQKFNEYKEAQRQENLVREQAMKDDFDKKISDLEAQLKDKSTPANKTTKEKTLSQSGKDLADKIRKLKIQKGDTAIDVTFGLRNLAVEAVAQLVEQGAKLGDAIKKVLSDEKFKDIPEDYLTGHIVEGLNKKSPEETLDAIKEYAKENDLTDVSKEMVGKNLISDYVNSHIGEVDQKDLLNTAAKDLKEVLPDITKKKLIEAYLKEGDYKQETKKDLEGGIAENKKQLRSIAKLEEDIADLNDIKDLRQRSFKNEREKSDYEQKLADEKASIIKEAKDRRNKIIDDNKRIETERNRQQKIISDLEEKKSNIENSITEKRQRQERKLDTPEIEKMRSDIKDLQKEIRDRNARIKNDNKMLETERNRQLQKVSDLTDKLDKLEKGVRDHKEKNPVKEDTPEIEALKKQVKDTDQKLREAEGRSNELNREAQNKKDKLAELDANIIRAQAGQDIIKTYRKDANRDVDAEIRNKQRQLKKAINDNSPEEKVQDKLLTEAKKKSIRDTKELQRRLDAGEFEDAEPRTRTKTDAELIKLDKEKAGIEEQFRKKQRELKEANKSTIERLADFARSVYVSFLIGSTHTLTKVGALAALRPLSESLTKVTLGKLYNTFFPGIAKAARAGGEGSNFRDIQKGFAAYFMQRREKGVEELSAKSEAAYQKANKDYQDYKNNYDKLKEANPKVQLPEMEKQLKSLESDRKEKLLSTLGNLVYQFIGGSSLKDAFKSLMERSNEIEKQFGRVEGESVKDARVSKNDVGKSMLGDVGKFIGSEAKEMSYVLGFLGRLHSALKTFSGRFSFAAGFMARMEAAVDNKEELHSDRVLEIAHESYLDWERGKYQQKNAITDLWNKALNHIDNIKDPELKTVGKIAAQALRFDVAITRVPVNILHEAVVEYTFGAVKAAILGTKAVRSAKESLAEDGILKGQEGFKQALRERVSQMNPEQAAAIVRAFRKGGVGVGLYALAAITGAIHFGVFPHLGQKKKKDEDKLAPDELNPGQVMFGNNKFGEIVSGILEHIPALWPMFMGLGMQQEYHNQIKKGRSTPEAVAQSFYTHLKILEGSIPQTKLIEGTQENVVNTIKKRLMDSGVISKSLPNGYDRSDKSDSNFKFVMDNNGKLPVFTPTTIEIPTTDKAGNPVMKKLNELPEKDVTEFNNERKANLKESIQSYMDGEEVYLDQYGKVGLRETTSHYDPKTFKELTPQQKEELWPLLGRKATVETKKKLYPQ